MKYKNFSACTAQPNTPFADAMPTVLHEVRFTDEHNNPHLRFVEAKFEKDAINLVRERLIRKGAILC